VIRELAEAGQTAGEVGSAFAAVFADYRDGLYSYVLRMMGNPDDAYDLTLSAFEKAFRAFPKLPPDANVKAWLFRIATNTCLDELRRRKVVRWQPLESFTRVFHPKQVARDNPERETIRKEQKALLREALGKLPEKQRAALLLREGQGLSCEQIGQVLGISQNAAKVLLFRAREQLRRDYLGLGGEPLD
jgi:RNA polymerase sigma-70 factor (ECF subfamily)